MADAFIPLREEDVDPDPLAQFSAWYEEAAARSRAPEAMAVASLSPDGVPSVRMVLCKGFDERGFVFFTNYESRKGLDLTANPRAALLFYWEALGRQVRIEGQVTRTSAQETAAYVHSRPRRSQLSALASPQSRTVESRAWLEQRVSELASHHGDDELPVPPTWGGFRVAPESYEFWQDREDRLHDRLRYTRDGGGGWVIERLAP